MRTEIFALAARRSKRGNLGAVAWATKLFQAGLTRTFSIEYDFRDLHQFRPEEALRTQAKQVAIPLARAIERLKALNLFERTLIVFYTTGREPASGRGFLRTPRIITGGPCRRNDSRRSLRHGERLPRHRRWTRVPTSSSRPRDRRTRPLDRDSKPRENTGGSGFGERWPKRCKSPTKSPTNFPTLPASSRLPSR